MTMKHHDCARAENTGLKLAEGIAIDPEELRFYKEHVAACDACGIELSVLHVLADDPGAGSLPGLDDLSRRRIVDAVLARADDPKVPSVAPSFQDRHYGNRAFWTGFACAAAAASIAALIFWKLPGTLPTAAPSAPMVLKSAPAALDKAAVAYLPEADARETSTVAQLEEIRFGTPIVTLKRKATVEISRGIGLVLGENTRLTMRSVESGVETVLDHGEILASVEPGRKDRSYAVVTPMGRIEVTGTLFHVKIQADSVEVQVLRGQVRLVENNGETSFLDAGSTASLGRPGPSRTLTAEETATLAKEVAVLLPQAEKVTEVKESALPVPPVETAETKEKPTSSRAAAPSAGDLLEKAQSLRASQNWPEAAIAYEDLIRLFPRSHEARASRVSLGEIRLEKLDDPAAAIKQFDTYLSFHEKGPLTQEALFNKALAQRQLGDLAAEALTLRLFLIRFPDAIQSVEVRRRLSDLAQDAVGTP